MELVGKRRTETVLESKQATTRDLTPDDEGLIPGIPNDITLQQVATKLPWRDIQVLSSVSRAWRQAVQSRQVYNARAVCNSNESFILFHHRPAEEINDIFLYSVRDKSCHKLPPVLSKYSQRVKLRRDLVTLDGKVYAFGDFSLYILNLAEQQQWKPCASMPHSIQWCGSSRFAAMNGKIYAFGGPPKLFRAEVYDPSKNAWSPIKHMPCYRDCFELAEAGDELVAHRGFVLKIEDNRPRYKRADFLSVYHPVKNEWREIPLRGPRRRLNAAGGRLYSITEDDIYLYDVHGQSWTHVHSFSFPASTELEAGVQYHKPIIVKAVLVDNELLAHVEWSSKIGSFFNEAHRSSLFQSKGFRTQKQLLWEEVEISFPFDLLSKIYPIQL
ncbi:unnamed protein product [Calypogeia fissa]